MAIEVQHVYHWVDREDMPSRPAGNYARIQVQLSLGDLDRLMAGDAFVGAEIGGAMKRAIEDGVPFWREQPGHAFEPSPLVRRDLNART